MVDAKLLVKLREIVALRIAVRRALGKGNKSDISGAVS